MKCLRLIGRQESCQFSYKNQLVIFFCDRLFVFKPALSTCSPFVLRWISKLFIDSIHILFLLYLLLWFGFSTSKLAGFHQNI